MRYLLLIALFVGGCVSTPRELMDTGDRSAHSLTLPPDRAAACVARNMENDRSAITTVRPRIDGDGFEVIARSAPDSVLAVAEIEPTGKTSRATIWLRGAWFYRKSEFIPAMIAGC